MKKLLAAGALGLLLAGGTVTGALAQGPGPNGNNDHGLCTAAQSGNKKGWKDGALPAPFAGAVDGDTDSDSDPGSRTDFIDQYCANFPPPPGQSK